MEPYTWRPVAEPDLTALAALDAACRATAGPASVPAQPYDALLAAPEVALLCATPEGSPDQIVASGWVQANGAQARLGGKVPIRPTGGAGWAPTCCAGGRHRQRHWGSRTP